jgi:hypothetical protein
VVLMNILVLPFILVLTPLGFTAGAVGLVWQPAGEAIAWAAGGLLKLMLMLVAWGNSLPGMLAELPSPDSLHITLMYGVLIGLVLLMTQPWVFRPRIKCVMAVFLVFLVSVYPVCRQWQGHSQLVVDWMSLSTNQAVVLIQPPGRAQPIAFVTPLARRNQRNLADFFRRQGIQGLSGLIHLTPVGSDPEEATRLSTPQQTSTARHYWLTASPKRPDELAYPVAAQYGPVTLDCDSPQHFRSSQNSLPACILDLAGRRWRLSEQLASMRWVIQGSRLWVYAHHAGE